MIRKNTALLFSIQRRYSYRIIPPGIPICVATAGSLAHDVVFQLRRFLIIIVIVDYTPKPKSEMLYVQAWTGRGALLADGGFLQEVVLLQSLFDAAKQAWATGFSRRHGGAKAQLLSRYAL